MTNLQVTHPVFERGVAARFRRTITSDLVLESDILEKKREMEWISDLWLKARYARMWLDIKVLGDRLRGSYVWV